jgi:hypothetical protein
VRLDDLFREVDEVTGTPLSDLYKLSYFMCHFQSDPRPGVATRIQLSTSPDATTTTCFALSTIFLLSPQSISNISRLSQRPQRQRRSRATRFAATFRRDSASIPTADTNMFLRPHPEPRLKLPHRSLLSRRACPPRQPTPLTSPANIVARSAHLLE